MTRGPYLRPQRRNIKARHARANKAVMIRIDVWCNEAHRWSNGTTRSYGQRTSKTLWHQFSSASLSAPATATMALQSAR
eukprot:7183875-Heterocapsa_arctica.AAC.1